MQKNDNKDDLIWRKDAINAVWKYIIGGAKSWSRIILNEVPPADIQETYFCPNCGTEIKIKVRRKSNEECSN